MKLGVIAAPLMVATLGASSADAEQRTPPPAPRDTPYSYVSTDVGYLSASGGGSATTLNIGVGFRNRHYAIEAGYEGTFVPGAAASGGFVDVFGYLPLGRHSPISLFATAGTSYVSAVFFNGYGYYASSFGVRGGGGVEVRLGEKWSLRGAVRYETTITDAAVASVGFTLRF